MKILRTLARVYTGNPDGTIEFYENYRYNCRLQVRHAFCLT
jgi:hypothetical protein